ncbi:hypothetical protein BY458DRAFT_528883, partial [Sporodiniella umbellata]
MVLTMYYSYLVWPSGLVPFGQTLNTHAHSSKVPLLARAFQMDLGEQVSATEGL